MTAAQRTMLFIMFNDLAKKRGWGSAQRDVEREAITLEAFRKPRSWSSFDNGDVDIMKAHLTVLVDPDSLDARVEEVDCADKGERRRLIYKIEGVMRQSNFAEAYVREICRSFYDTAEWRELPLDRLTNIRDTLNSRSYAKRRAHAAPVNDNEPF